MKINTFKKHIDCYLSGMHTSHTGQVVDTFLSQAYREGRLAHPQKQQNTDDPHSALKEELWAGIVAEHASKQQSKQKASAWPAMRVAASLALIVSIGVGASLLVGQLIGRGQQRAPIVKADMSLPAGAQHATVADAPTTVDTLNPIATAIADVQPAAPSSAAPSSAAPSSAAPSRATEVTKQTLKESEKDKPATLPTLGERPATIDGGSSFRKVKARKLADSKVANNFKSYTNGMLPKGIASKIKTL